MCNLNRDEGNQKYKINSGSMNDSGRNIGNKIGICNSDRVLGRDSDDRS